MLWRLPSYFYSDAFQILMIAVIGAVVIVVLDFLLKRAVDSAVARAVLRNTERAKRIRTVVGILRAALNVILGLALFLIILDRLKVNIAPILTGAGIAGFAVGFGAQSLIKDLISGLLIVLENQFSVGDRVSIKGITGIVEHMTVRSTTIRSDDGTLHYIPNSAIDVVSNFSRGGREVESSGTES